MKKNNIKVIFLLILFLFSCNNKQNIKEVQFNISKDLIAKDLVFKNNYFSFNPPKLSIKFDNKNDSIFKASISNDNSLLNESFIQGYTFLNSGIIITELIDHEIPSNYIELLKNHYNTNFVESDFFLYNDIEFHQYILRNNSINSIILFLNFNKIFRIQFLSNSEEYHQMIRSIESSIGTIKRKDST